MGVLDDAIREHLELKRQHGASADEVTRQEQEALGAVQGQPVTSEPAAVEPDAADVPDEPDAANALPDEPAEPVTSDAALAEPEPEPERELEIESEPDPPPAAVPLGDTPPRGFEEVPEAPAPAREPSLADADPGEEDVLEETPEFLQETPEHDRLWFEQKPPREFDFDE